MANRVDNPLAVSRPEVARPGTQGERPQQPKPSEKHQTDRVEISAAAQHRAEAPAREVPSARPESAASALNEPTRNQAAQLREQQEAANQPQSQQPGNLVDVTG